jgi:protein-tyrosine kinase
MDSLADHRNASGSPPTNPPPPSLGQQLVTAGKLTEKDVIRVIDAQRLNRLRFGEAAVGLGLLSQDELRAALSHQYAYPHMPIGTAELHPLLFTAHSPSGSQAEALRTLRSQLMLRWFGEHRSIAVTSARGGEGASCLAANLAIVFAQMGERTLLIDANFRKPTQHLLFDVNWTAGLATFLTGRCATRAAVMQVPAFETLSIVCAGPVPQNPQELLGRIAFLHFIDTMRAAFDIIIIDTPPLLEFADAQLVAVTTGGCLVSMRRHQTRLADLERVKTQIAPTGARLLGAVVYD